MVNIAVVFIYVQNPGKIMNGIEQAILEELLGEAKSHTTLLSRLAASSGSGGGKNPPSGFPKLADDASALSKSFGAVGFAAGTLAGVLTGTFSVALSFVETGLTNMANIAGNVYEGQKMLAQASINGTNGLSSFYDSLSNLPGVLGLAAQMFSYQTKVLEKNLQTFQAMSQSGATLGGNLDLVRESAKGMGLSMDEFANVMKNNTAYFLNFGETADAGAKALIKFNTTMINGTTGKALLGMGYSLEEANNMLGTYSATMGGVSREQLGNQKEMEGSVKSFAEELSASAILEGKSRQQKQEEMKERSLIAARENLMSKMTAEQKQAFVQVENAALRSGGKAAADAMLAHALGMGPVTKESQQYVGMFGESALKFNQMTDLAMTATASNASQIQTSLIKTGADAQFAQAQQSKNYGVALSAIALSGKGPQTIANAALLNEARLRESGMDSAKKIADRDMAVRGDLSKAQESEAGAVAQRAARAKYQGEWLMNSLAAMLEPLKPVLTALVHTFVEFVPKVISFGTDIVNKIIVPLFHNLFGGLKLDDIARPFKEFFSGLFGGRKMDFSGIEKSFEDVLGPLVRGLGFLFNSIDWFAVGTGVKKVFGILGEIGLVGAHGLFIGINILIGVFNVLSSVVTAVYNVVNTLLEPFGGFSGIIDDIESVFESLYEKFNTYILPVLDSAGSSLTQFSNWIDDSTKTIKGPLKVAFDALIFGIGAVAGYFGAMTLIQLAWSAVTSIATLGMAAFDIVVGIAAGALALLTSPVFLVVAGISLMAGLLYELYEHGFTFKTVLQELSLAGGYLKDVFSEFMDWLRGFLPSFLGGISDDQKKKNADQRAQNLKEREEEQKKIDDQNLQTKKERGIKEPAKPAIAPKLGLLTNPLAQLSQLSTPDTTNLQSQNLAKPKAQPTREAPKPAPKVIDNSKDKKEKLKAEKALEVQKDDNDVDKRQNNTNGPGTSNDDSIQLNRGVQMMIKLLREIDSNTGKTNNLIASGGNMFRR